MKARKVWQRKAGRKGSGKKLFWKKLLDCQTSPEFFIQDLWSYLVLKVLFKKNPDQRNNFCRGLIKRAFSWSKNTFWEIKSEPSFQHFRFFLSQNYTSFIPNWISSFRRSWTRQNFASNFWPNTDARIFLKDDPFHLFLISLCRNKAKTPKMIFRKMVRAFLLWNLFTTLWNGSHIKEIERVCVCVCVFERERVWESECVWMWVCVYERESMCVSVC